jgi:predicted DNA-binding transcriptional regulator AlpA
MVKPDELLTAEVACVLGVSRQRVLELAAADPAFPRSQPTARGGHGWSRAAVLAWAATAPDLGPVQHGPTLPPVGRLAPQVWKVRDLAAAEARALNHDWVGPEHLLVALAHPECPEAAPAVLASFGITPGQLRAAIIAGHGDPFEPGTGWITPSPATRSVLERAHLEAVLLADAEVTSEHVLLALVSYWTRDPDTATVAALGGIDLALVRRRVLDYTEGIALPQPPPAAEAPELQSDQDVTYRRPPELELAPTPDGKDPRQRRPWGSRMFLDGDGKPILWADKEPRQYFVDRDGHPVLTSDGSPVHIARGEHGQDVLDEDGRPVVTVVEIPEGSTVRPAV